MINMKSEIRSAKSETISKFEFKDSNLSRISNFEFRASMQKGFTIVETLVAIAILMIAIAGPLTIANQALGVAVGARNQMIAANLAQETVEYVKNVKDNNLASGNFWLAFIPDCTVASPCGASPIEGGDPTAILASIKFCSVLNLCKLSAGDQGYVYNASYSYTPFSRNFYLTSSLGDPSRQKEVMLTVVVSWNNGPIPNQIQIQELLTNTVR